MPQPSNLQYIALSTSSTDVVEIDGTNLHTHGPVEFNGSGPEYGGQNAPPSIRYAIWIAVVCAVANTLSVVFQRHALQPRPRTFSEPEYANAYIGLEHVYHDPDSPPPPPILNFPAVFALVNSSSQKQTYVDDHRVASGFGTYYPEDRQVLISNQVSTIVQFFAGDFGMERCTLEIRIPPAGAKDLISLTSTASIHLWALDTNRLLDTGRVTWQTRPKRKSLLGAWDVAYNQTFVSHDFDCPTRSFQAFELCCAPTATCEVDFQQRLWTNTLGVWLIQRSTLSKGT